MRHLSCLFWRLMIVFAIAVAPALAAPNAASASICDSPSADWLMCEDFEGAAAGWASWFASSDFVECRGCTDGVNDPNRLYLSDDPAHVFDGRYAMHMPAEAGSGFQGGELIFHDCVGEDREGCDLHNHERLFLRTRVKLAADHAYVHHFLSINGTRPDAYWEGSGNAGCRPNGVRHAGTTVDFDTDHRLFFYTYYPDMHCDAGGYCSGSYATDICNGCAERGLGCESGPECCWGNLFEPEPPAIIPRGEWVCIEMMMQLNTPGASDGEMAFWIDDALMHSETGMHWRDVEELGLNGANMSHYIERGDADRPNRISFDDFIVSTARIGCDMTPAAPADDAGVPMLPGSDAGSIADGGGAGPRDPTSPDAGGDTHDGGEATDAMGGCTAAAAPPGSAGFISMGVLSALWLSVRRRRPAERKR